MTVRRVRTRLVTAMMTLKAMKRMDLSGRATLRGGARAGLYDYTAGWRRGSPA